MLRRVLDEQWAVYARDNTKALKLLSVGEAKRNGALDAAEFGARTNVASVILSLDEAVTRGGCGNLFWEAPSCSASGTCQSFIKYERYP